MPFISTLPKVIRQNFELLEWGLGLIDRPKSPIETKLALMTATRTAIAAAAFFAMRVLPKYSAVIALGTFFVSLPAFGMTLGFLTTSSAVTLISQSILLNKAENVFFTIVKLISTWNFVKWSRNIPFGACEAWIDSFSTELTCYLYSDIKADPSVKAKENAELQFLITGDIEKFLNDKKNEKGQAMLQFTPSLT